MFDTPRLRFLKAWWLCEPITVRMDQKLQIDSDIADVLDQAIRRSLGCKYCENTTTDMANQSGINFCGNCGRELR